jgi:hypothetical protein
MQHTCCRGPCRPHQSLSLLLLLPLLLPLPSLLPLVRLRLLLGLLRV